MKYIPTRTDTFEIVKKSLGIQQDLRRCSKVSFFLNGDFIESGYILYDDLTNNFNDIPITSEMARLFKIHGSLKATVNIKGYFVTGEEDERVALFIPEKNAVYYIRISSTSHRRISDWILNNRKYTGGLQKFCQTFSQLSEKNMVDVSKTNDLLSSTLLPGEISEVCVFMHNKMTNDFYISANVVPASVFELKRVISTTCKWKITGTLRWRYRQYPGPVCPESLF